MRYRRWIDVVKEYDYKILYHPGKANVAADALSQRTVSTRIWDVCLWMTVVTLVLDMIGVAQS